MFAHWPAADPAAPVVLVYGHHDVQPVEPLEEWDQPAVRARRARRPAAGQGRLRRQGPGAVPRARAPGRRWPRPAPARSPVTLKLLIEGEEESGSPHFAALLRRERERLACDVIVISDTTMWAADVPSMCIGMRGLAEAEIELRGAGAGPALGLVRRRRAQPAARPGRPAGRAARRRGPGHDAGLLRRGAAAVGGGAGAVRAAAVRREGLAGRGGQQRRRGRRGRASAPWSGSGPGRPPRSTACGAGTPGRAARPSSRPPRTPSCRSGWSPTRSRPRSSPGCASTWRSTRRPASRPR